MIMRFLLSLYFLWCPISFAYSLESILARLNEETLKTEFWSLDCLVAAQKDKILVQDCYWADNSLRTINAQLVNLVHDLTEDADQYDTEFYTALTSVKQMRTRLRKVDNNLARVKRITGFYNWSNTLYPSYYQQQ